MAFWVPQPSWITELVSSVKLGKMSQGTTHLKERLDGLTPFTNSDAGALAYGDLLVQDAASGERKFKKSPATAGTAGPFFVCLDAVPIGGTGYAAHIGHVDLKYTGTAPVVGNQLQSSGTAGAAMVGTTNPLAVAYANALGGTVQAILFGPSGTAGGGGGGGGLLDFGVARVPPVLSALTPWNQNATVPYTQDGALVNIYAGQIESFPNLRMLIKTAATAHWHFRCLVLVNCSANYFGVAAIHSATSRFVAMRVGAFNNTGMQSYINSFHSPTSHERGVSGAHGEAVGNWTWLHTWWDGTTMRFGLTADGRIDIPPNPRYGITPAEVVMGAGNIPNQFGVFIEGTSALFTSRLTIASWEELPLA